MAEDKAKNKKPRMPTKFKIETARPINNTEDVAQDIRENDGPGNEMDKSVLDRKAIDETQNTILEKELKSRGIRNYTDAWMHMITKVREYERKLESMDRILTKLYIDNKKTLNEMAIMKQREYENGESVRQQLVELRGNLKQMGGLMDRVLHIANNRDDPLYPHYVKAVSDSEDEENQYPLNVKETP